MLKKKNVKLINYYWPVFLRRDKSINALQICIACNYVRTCMKNEKNHFLAE